MREIVVHCKNVAGDVMTSDGAYRKAIPVQVAADEMVTNAGTQLAPYIGEQFLKKLCNRGEVDWPALTR